MWRRRAMSLIVLGLVAIGTLGVRLVALTG